MLSVNCRASRLPGSVTPTVSGGVVTLSGSIASPPTGPVTGTLVVNVNDDEPFHAALAEIIRFSENPVTGGLTLGTAYTDAPSPIIHVNLAGAVQAHKVDLHRNNGDEVSPFGNGFDVYRQHQAVNTMIIGWPATKGDPGTHFIREAGTIRGTYRFEYAPNGKATGLCVSDPGYDAAGTGLRDGLVLRAANNGPWQQWYPMEGGRLSNAATGLIITPNGTAAQLRGTVHRASMPAGSAYTWTDYAHLPR